MCAGSVWQIPAVKAALVCLEMERSYIHWITPEVDTTAGAKPILSHGFVRVSDVSARAQILDLSSVAFARALAGIWIKIGAART